MYLFIYLSSHIYLCISIIKKKVQEFDERGQMWGRKKEESEGSYAKF